MLNFKDMGKILKKSVYSRRTHPREYSIWAQMKNRCNSITCPDYPRYGGRGIKVCFKWENCFDDFLADVGLCPSKNHTLDRIENDKGYQPGNIRWATKKEQQNNRRTNVRIEFNGETKTLQQWCELYNISPHLVSARLRKMKWPIHRALTEPANQKYNHSKTYMRDKN